MLKNCFTILSQWLFTTTYLVNFMIESRWAVRTSSDFHPGYPIDGNWCSENQSINRYQSIKLVNWYRLESVNRWAIDNHTKIVHRLSSIGTGPLNRQHARYLSDHPSFLGSSGDEIGKTIPTQSSHRTRIQGPRRGRGWLKVALNLKTHQLKHFFVAKI